jgi:hypothetical protein
MIKRKRGFCFELSQAADDALLYFYDKCALLTGTQCPKKTKMFVGLSSNLSVKVHIF